MNDTIAAIATAHGEGSICILRLSGEKAYEIALKICKKSFLKPRFATLCKLHNPSDDELIDEAIVIFFKAPFSFTGENVTEFQIHGGIGVANVLLEVLLKNGARLANAGEFSKRACMNGKLTPLKALQISDLIKANSAQAAKIIARNLEGKLGEKIDKIRLDLVKTLAFVETSIDYADDDLPPNLLEDIKTMCEENARILSEIYEISQSKKGLIEGFKIAIIGKPNVGKSSLLNAFLNYERAIVSNIAGTTRDKIEENFKLGTHLVKIVDTAGIRDTNDEIEKIGAKLSKKALLDADIIIALFDNSREIESEDEQILELLKEADKKIFYVLNKCDLESKFNQNLNFIKISTKTDINPLKSALLEYLNSQKTDAFIVSSLDLINACNNASKAILRAKELISEENLELFAFELNLAINELAKFSKDFERSEILDEMFANFCLGK